MPQPLTDAINALTTYANSVTGQSDQTLSEAVATLASGYGGGGSDLLYNWDFKTSLTDTVAGSVATLSNCTQDSSGLHFTSSGGRVTFDRGFPNINVTYEIDVSEMDRQGTNHSRFFMITAGDGVCYRSTGYWGSYNYSSWKMSTETDPNYFAGHTAKIVYDEWGHVFIYRDNTLLLSVGGTAWIGPYSLGANAQAFYNMTITGFRVIKGNTTVSG